MGAAGGGAGSGLVPAGSVNDKLIDDHLAVQAIIRSYQVKLIVNLRFNLKKLSRKSN